MPRWDDEVDVSDIEANERLRVTAVRQSREVVSYSTESYLDVLSTYSGHIALGERDRSRLSDCIARTIDRDFGGTIEKAYGMTLIVAERT